MSTVPQKNSVSRFRPRFSVRTLAIFVTLVCAYFGAWEATKRYGVPPKAKENSLVVGEVNRTVVNVIDGSSPMPLIVRQSEIEVGHPFEFVYSKTEPSDKYYLWLFGPKIKLPFESD